MPTNTRWPITWETHLRTRVDFHPQTARAIMKDGWTARSIAVEMNLMFRYRFTKSAILGKIRRLAAARGGDQSRAAKQSARAAALARRI